MEIAALLLHGDKVFTGGVCCWLMDIHENEDWV